MKAKLKIFDEVISWILLIAVCICLCFSMYSVYQAKTTGEPAFLFGYRPVFVLTGSMEPYMMTNSVALTKKVETIDEIAVGDVITFHVENEAGKTINVTHRIVDINNGFINTKGDNNNVDDNLALTMDNVDAKVVTVFNQTAWLIAEWQTTSGKVMIISFAVGIVLLFITIRCAIGAFTSKKKEESDETAPENHPKQEGEGTPENIVASDNDAHNEDQ